MIRLYPEYYTNFLSMSYMSLPENNYTWNGTERIPIYVQTRDFQPTPTSGPGGQTAIISIPYRNAYRVNVETQGSYAGYVKSRNFEQTNGICFLNDAITCVVTNENNGAFELEMTYPVDGAHFDDIRLRRIIATKTSPFDDHDQAFRIYRISKAYNGIITINAAHISYDLSKIPIWRDNAYPLQQDLNYVTGTDAIDTIADYVDGFRYRIERAIMIHQMICKNNFSIDSSEIAPFEFHYWWARNSAFNFDDPKSVKNFIGGEENSVLGAFGGDLIFDNFEIWLMTDDPNAPSYKKKGDDNGVIIRYGSNILDVTNEISSDIQGNYIIPYWHDTIGNLDMIVYPYQVDRDHDPNDIFYRYYPKLYPNVEAEITPVTTDIVTMDFTDIIDTSDFTETMSTDEKVYRIKSRLIQAAKSYISNNQLDKIVSTLNISFLNESDPNLESLSKIKLCDTVTCVIEQYGIAEKMKCNKTTYDAISDTYISIELGVLEKKLSYTLASLKKNSRDEKWMVHRYSQDDNA